MSIKQQPDWWRYSESSWQKLLLLMLRLHEAFVDECYKQSNWLLLQQGSSNTNFKLSIGAHRYFVQLVDKDKLSLLPDGEYRSQTQLVSESPALSKWIPECLLDSDDIRVAIWVETSPTVHNHFDQPQLVVELCRLLTELHQSELTLPALDMDEYLARYYKIAQANSSKDALRSEVLYQQGQKLAGYFEATHSCHNDVSPGNLLRGPQLYLVDWEYAALSDPLFELAGVICNFELTGSQELNLVEEYGRQSQRAVDLEKLEAMKSLYRIIGELWYMGNSAPTL